jgi:glycine betaine/proline transport system ATP-binding protein
MSEQPVLSCRHLWKVYGTNADASMPSPNGQVDDTPAHIDKLRSEQKIVAVGDVSFDVKRGETFVIMGLSGSGKSTVIRCLSRLTEPTAGEVLLDGNNLLAVSNDQLIDIRRHKMGMVFQNFGLLPHMTVLENVAFPLTLQKQPQEVSQARALQMVELVGLSGREEAFPRELSGGQQQRVGIARSLAVDPELWFLDEPFSALDPLIRRQMQDEFMRLQQQLHKTIVFITHDFLEALRVGDRVAIMKEGRFIQVGTPSEIVLKPANDYVREFVQDVPRIRVVKARDVMTPLKSLKGGGNPVSPDTPLEDLLGPLARTNKPIGVQGDDGKLIGCVDSTSIIAGLASLQDDEPAATSS